MAERLVIDQALCDKVKKLMSRGIDTKDIVEILSISQSTVSRIQTADFDVEKYREMNENRRKAELDRKKAEEQKSKMDKYMADIQATEEATAELLRENEALRRQEATAELLRENEALRRQEQQVPGQMKMELPEPAEEKPRDFISRIEGIVYDNVMKLVKAEYANADKILMKLDKLNDTMSQILRAIRKE